MSGRPEQAARERSPGAPVARETFETATLTAVRAALVGGVRGVRLVPGRPTCFEEHFLDTRDHRFHRAGLSLVTRDLGGGFEVALVPHRLVATPLASIPGSPISMARLNGGSLDDTPPPLARPIRALRGTRRLHELFALETTHEDWVVWEGDRWIAAVTLVDARAIRPRGADGLRLHRVEVRARAESARGSHPFLEELQRRGGLTSTTATPYEAARLALGLPEPCRLPTEPPALRPDQSAADAALAILRTQFARVLENEPGTRLGLDVEALHRMRVAVRRMRVAMSMHRANLSPRLLGLRAELSWLGGELGRARDLDVQRESLDAWRAKRPPAEAHVLAPLEARFAEHRRTAQAELLEALDSDRFRHLVRRVRRALLAPPADDTTTRSAIAPVALALVRKRWKKFLRAGRALRPTSPAADYHRVRILAKRLRYCLEFHAPVLGPDAAIWIAHARRVQDTLGAGQDAEVFLDRLRTLADDSPDWPARTADAIDLWRDSLERVAVKSRRRFAAAFRAPSRVRWKRVATSLRHPGGADAARPQTPPEPPARPGKDRT
ncbi:MAG: CHAD domain-containing protein [bacterium]